MGEIVSAQTPIPDHTGHEFGDLMLSKCANPTCPTTFRYLHEGRLYVIAPRKTLTGCKPRCSSKSGQLEYAWLCSSCSLYLTIQIDEEVGMRVVRKFEAKNGSKFGTPPYDRNKMDTA
jgi:hypothetical protein